MLRLLQEFTGERTVKLNSVCNQSLHCVMYRLFLYSTRTGSSYQKLL
jgi:hypothetical protein